jgi:hypothetical protein
LNFLIQSKKELVLPTYADATLFVIRRGRDMGVKKKRLEGKGKRLYHIALGQTATCKYRHKGHPTQRLDTTI